MKKYVIANNTLYDTQTSHSSYPFERANYTTDGTVLIKHYSYCTSPEPNEYGIVASVAIYKTAHEIVGVIQRESDDILGLLHLDDFCKIKGSSGLLHVDESTIDSITADVLEELWIDAEPGTMRRIWSKQ